MSYQGRKKSSFTKEQLENYLQQGKSYREIKFLLNAGEVVVRRRIKEWGLEALAPKKNFNNYKY